LTINQILNTFSWLPCT